MFNFQNTYLELLAAGGEGIGADLIKHMLANSGEGLNGIVFGSVDMNQFEKTSCKNASINLAEIFLRRRDEIRNGRERTWINQFF